MVSSKSVFKNYLSTVYFAVFLVVLGPFGLYEEFDDRYPKRPVSVTTKDISDQYYQSVYISSGFGCKNSSKVATFGQKMRIL